MIDRVLGLLAWRSPRVRMTVPPSLMTASVTVWMLPVKLVR